MKKLGRQATKTEVPYTVVTSWDVPLRLKEFFPQRTTFVKDENAGGTVFFLPTAQYNQWKRWADQENQRLYLGIDHG